MRAVADLSEGEVRGEIGGAERGVRRTGDFNILIGVRAGLVDADLVDLDAPRESGLTGVQRARRVIRAETEAADRPGAALAAVDMARQRTRGDRAGRRAGVESAEPGADRNLMLEIVRADRPPLDWRAVAACT